MRAGWEWGGRGGNGARGGLVWIVLLLLLLFVVVEGEWGDELWVGGWEGGKRGAKKGKEGGGRRRFRKGVVLILGGVRVILC